MSERVYVIPLRNVKEAPRWNRSKKAISIVRDFLRDHMKATDVKIDQSINEHIWKRGAKKPPSKIEVVAKKEGDIVEATLKV